MKREIIKYFQYMTAFTSMKVTRIECLPIPYWGETYVTGFKVDDSNNVMVHFKVVKRLDLTEARPEQVEYYMMNPDCDFWLPYELIDETSIDETFADYEKALMAENHLHVLHVEGKRNGKEVEENILFLTKRVACKEAMEVRKEYTIVKIKFYEVGEKPKTEKKISAFDFATSALD